MGYSIIDLPHIAPLLVAYGGFRSINVQPGETVLVAPGTGWYSGAAVEVASAMGARVIAAGRNEDTLSRLAQALPRVHAVHVTGDEARDQEALAKFGPIDVMIDFTPQGIESPLYLQSSIGALAHGGRVVLMGFAYGNLAADYGQMLVKNLTIKGRYMYERKDIGGLIKLIEAGMLKLGSQAGQEILAYYTLDGFEQAIAQSAQTEP